MKYSIIIPTYENDEAQTNLESVMCESHGEDFEVILVCNGDESYAKRHMNQYPSDLLKVLSFPEPLGYTVATNIGISVAKGEYVVLLNDDCKILDFCEPGEWLRMLSAPFDDPTVGITGPSKLHSDYTGRKFLVFFCAMMRRELFYEIGNLDESFSPGGGEDIDFCMRAEAAGYRLVQVPEELDDWQYETSFPIYHEGERTVHDETKVSGWEEGFAARMDLIRRRTAAGYYSDLADVTCEISTRGRYGTTLPMTIMSVISQSLKPKRLIIFQDDPDVFDMRSSSTYVRLFGMLEAAGIFWEVAFGDGSGQVRNHQKALEAADTEWVWRIDDDEVAEPDVLEKLMMTGCSDDEIGAVAPCVYTPGDGWSGDWSTRIEDVLTHGNLQWLPPGELVGQYDAEHLYSTFIYRRRFAQPYDVEELSPAGHREETLFTHRIHRNGGRLVVDRTANVSHFREPSGGIRAHRDIGMWERDEAYFLRQLDHMGVVPNRRLLVNLSGGMGDHYMFRMALPEILEAHPDETVVVCAAHPGCLEDVEGIRVESVQYGIDNVRNFDDLNVYKWCGDHAWKGSLVDAFKEIYT